MDTLARGLLQFRREYEQKGAKDPLAVFHAIVCHLADELTDPSHWKELE